jgi:CRISPR-associated exonuclease Cas4
MTIDFQSEIQTALEADNDPDSHVEHDPGVFHASQMGYCLRQAYLSKTGLKDTTDILGTFKTGTLIHEWLEAQLGDRLDHVAFEEPVETQVGDLTFLGHADAVDRENNVVYDFKTRGSWYRFNPPVQRHLDQLYVYMHALGFDDAQVVYLSKQDMDVKTWPEHGTFRFDDDRFETLVSKAREIRDALDADGVATTPDDVPFEPCGCFVCENESLAFD